MMDAVHDAKRLAELQALPLSRKVQITQTRIIEWYQHYNGNVCVSFSGGKDSTVLLHLVRQLYPDVPAVFSNTGLEYPEIQKFVRSFENVDVVTPKMRFGEVISTYGYPLISKEVAEAIYYARRIRSQTVQVERERERERTAGRKRAEMYGKRTRTAGWIERFSNQDDSCKHEGNALQAPRNGGGERQPHPDERSAEQTDSLARKDARTQTSRGETSWSNWRRGCL